MTKKEILELKLEFKSGNMTMIDWFQISEGAKFFRISSGLKHANDITKSPFYYEDFAIGKNAEKQVLKKFNEWWLSLNYEK